MKTCPVCAVENPDTNQCCSGCGGLLDPALVETLTDPSHSKSRSGSASDSDSSVHGRFLPGTKIADRYRIVSLAGRGGMGEVYRADDLKLGHPVALKFLPREVAEGSRGFEYFLAEVRLSRQIAHPNVCRVYDIAEVDAQHFLSMEYIDGEDLKGLLRRIGRLPEDKGIQIAQQLCAGLAAAHEKGVLHRDLKPANIMIDGRGQVRITDFGLARLAESGAGTGEISGTPAYMAPEQLARGETTIQSDLYSLGLILYELFTGQAVHQSGSVQEVMRSHRDSTLTQPSTLVADLDPTVERVIVRCLQKEPARRPKSARAVAAALPGGDPLAAVLAAGETPSPEMVAAAGEAGAIEKRLGLTCLAGVAVGLAVVCWLAQRTYLVNQVGLDRHPISLADNARRMIERFGYTNTAARQAHGFRVTGHDMRFWYRQVLAIPKIPVRYWNEWGEQSLARMHRANPPWGTPGETGLELDARGKLVQFRAVPRREPAQTTGEVKPVWHEWFPEDLTGLDLKTLETLEPVPDRGVPLPDAYDQLQCWRSATATGGVFYVQAAAYNERPVYFAVLSPAEFKGDAPFRAMWDPYQEAAARGRGANPYLVLALLVWVGAGALAWRNVRLGRTDRRGAFRVALFLFCIGMVRWLLLASHIGGGYELGVLEMGVAQVLFVASTFWVCYSALEPYARRVWPQVLISWTRLLDGRWRDPLVGQNLLLGVLAGVGITIVIQLEVLAPPWLGLGPLSFIPSHPSTLDGPWEFAARILHGLGDAVREPVFGLVLLLLLRLVLRRTWLVSCAFVVVMTVTFTLLYQANPVIGWFFVGAAVSLSLWVYLRLGYLAGGIMSLTYGVLTNFPITTNFTAWYAGNGFAAVVLLLALAGFGFYTSQAGRPIFDERLAQHAAD